MAGALTIDTLNASSGPLSTNNGMTGIAKAWVKYSGTTQTILGSYNVSSVTRTGVGVYIINFTTSMPNANYSASANSTQGDTLGVGDLSQFVRLTTNNYTASGLKVGVVNSFDTAFTDSTLLTAVIFSS